jgi:hypothetical protein
LGGIQVLQALSTNILLVPEKVSIKRNAGGVVKLQ